MPDFEQTQSCLKIFMQIWDEGVFEEDAFLARAQTLAALQSPTITRAIFKAVLRQPLQTLMVMHEDNDVYAQRAAEELFGLKMRQHWFGGEILAFRFHSQNSKPSVQVKFRAALGGGETLTDTWVTLALPHED